MCGIVGYYGKQDAMAIILKGLESLEYRGYDSAGLVLLNDEGKIICAKEKGRLKDLEASLEAMKGTIGIGHTRWATHGAPSKNNAHPHLSEDESFAVVHNGIIENYLELKKELVAKGYHFESETDTEVIVHLLKDCDKGNFLEAFYCVMSKLKGAYALGVMSSRYPTEFIAARKESPLIVGLGEEEYFVASDVPALLSYTRQVYYLDNQEVVWIKDGVLKVLNQAGESVDKEKVTVDWDVEAASKSGFEHFMLKEIHDQPQAIRETLLRRLDEAGRLKLDDITLKEEDLEHIHHIQVVACGTAYHAGLVGRAIIEKLARIPVQVAVASEYRYSDPFVDEHTLLIVVSQSGETADTLAALKEAKRKGARVLAITNVVGSSVAREADDVFYTWAGPEISVASTKAYTAQLVAFYMIALHLASINKAITQERYNEIIIKLQECADQVELLLMNKEKIKQVAEGLLKAQSIFYLGRGLDYTAAMEAALKLKEISYIHTEAFAAGELKHGTIALIEEGTPVLVMATQDTLIEKMVSNIKEVKARGAYVIGFAKQGEERIKEVADEIIALPVAEDLLMPIISIIPAQLMAYYASVLKGNDVDKPRNLAKSVTVE